MGYERGNRTADGNVDQRADLMTIDAPGAQYRRTTAITHPSIFDPGRLAVHPNERIGKMFDETVESS
jgi:hypothetical protein